MDIKKAVPSDKGEIDKVVERDINMAGKAAIAVSRYGRYSSRSLGARQAAWDSHMETYGFCSNTRPR